MTEQGKAFGRWLEYQLARREWTQAEFARRVPTSTGSVSMWINGIRVPDPESCERIALAFDILAEDVLKKAGHLATVDPEEDEALADLVSMLRRLALKPSREYILRNMMRAWIDEDREGFVVAPPVDGNHGATRH